MKSVIVSQSVLFLLLFCSQVCFAQAVPAQKILSVVRSVEDSWNATSPDKSYMSDGNKMQYGVDYLKAGNYSSAAWSLEEILAKNPNDPYANFFMGCVKLGLNDKPSAGKYFEMAGKLNASLKERTGELTIVNGSSGDASNEKKPDDTGDTKPKEATTGTSKTSGLNHYKAGDKVEVSHAGGWWPGVVTKVEGEDKSVYVKVDYKFQGTSYTESFFYNGIRPASGNTTNYEAASKPGGPLVYGDYTLMRGLGSAATRVGYFTLYANGSYQYFDVKGTYAYNAATGVITWKSGTFFNWGKNVSTFTKGKRVSQIDMTYPQTSGPLYYSGGHNN